MDGPRQEERSARCILAREFGVNSPIHFEGFAVVATNRVYTFSVADRSDERKFTVEIQAISFRSAEPESGPLKFQDGPAICAHRILREMDQEGAGRAASCHLTINTQDIEDYLNTQFPKKSTRKRVVPFLTNP